jgi:Tfp pilus assembly protein PilF
MSSKKAPILFALFALFFFVSTSNLFIAAGYSYHEDHKDKKEKDKQERGIRIKSVKELPAKANRYALVVGIDQYNDGQINRLDGAANDAKALADALVTYSGFSADQVILLTSNQSQNLQPSRVNILRKLSNLTSGSVPKDGLLLLFFAGHGIEKDGRAFLLPNDAEVSNDLNLLEDTAIPVERITNMIRQSGIQQIILILDACRNNPETGRGDENEKLSKGYTRGFDFETKNSEITAFVTLYASELGQTAYEYKEKKHGYFTWALIEGMKGGAANDKGEITLSNLRKYIQENVPKRVSLDLGAGKRQRPFAEIKGYKAEDLVFAWVKPVEAKPIPNVITIDPSAKDLVFWESIKDNNDPALFQAYLDKFPNGDFVAIAKNRLTNLQAQHPTSATGSEISKSVEPVEKTAKQSTAPTGQITPGDKGKVSDPKSTYIPKTRSGIEEGNHIPDKAIAKLPDPVKAPTNSTIPDPPVNKGKVIDESKPKETAIYPDRLKSLSEKEEKIHWDSIVDSLNPEDFKIFLTAFPKGKFASKATTKVTELTELADWNAIKNSDKKDEVIAFLARYPKSSYTAQAKARLIRIDEDVYWNSIKDKQGLDNFKTYLVLYPKGAYAEEAKARIKELSGVLNTLPSDRSSTGKIEAIVNIPVDKVGIPTTPASENTLLKTHLLSAEKFIQEKKWKAAAEVLNQIILLEPQKAEWHFRLGSILNSDKRWDEADSQFKTAINLEPENARWQNARGLFLTSRGQHPEAIEACKKATDLEPANARFHVDLSQVHLNQYGIRQEDLYQLKANRGLRNRLLRIDQGDIHSAQTEAEKAVNLEPENPEWHIHLGKVLAWVERWSDAEREVRQAILLNPGNAEWHNQLGLILLAQEKNLQAGLAFREAIRLAPANGLYRANLKKAES